ncbi:hypothetical protein FBU30_010669 [Linnemannia zychae]|nr:hypothetical protein FBU30_010669 [Linnemannia zychae]
MITLFDTDIMVSGSNQGDNELANWQEIAPGSYTFPFALKVPNINFPPCIPGLDGFSIRYVWKAHVESPFEPNLSSEEILCQFMPIVLAPKPLGWTYREVVGVVMSKSTTQVNRPPTGIDVSIKMHQQVYVPGDPLSMATTLINHGQGKVAAIDVVLRRTIKGTVPTAYANLSNQYQTDIMTKSVECKVRPGETGQVDILTTIPPLGKNYSIPTFESNFLKVYYELICIFKVKRSVFSGGDTTYQCTFPIPIATHNVDNPIITGTTPRWTRSRLQPYFFEPSWADPIGDLPGSLANNVSANITNVNNSNGDTATSSATGESNLGKSALASASAASLLSNSGSGTNAMQEFLTGGSAELHRERTLKKSLTRSKSMKDLHTPRLNGSSWRAEREQLLNQSREQSNNGTQQLDRSSTDGGHSSSNNGFKRSPPLGASKSPSSSDDWQQGQASAPGVIDSNGNVGYTPPPPTNRPPKSAHRDLTPEQQAELVRKASRRILPNQGLYNNDGVLPPEVEARYQTQSSNNNNVPTTINTSVATNNSLNKPLPRRNASLSQKAHYQQQGGANGTYIPEQDTVDTPATPAPSRSGSGYNNNNTNNSGANGGYEPTRSNTGSSSNDQSYSRQSSGHQDGVHPVPERVPYQHSLPAHQQPPGVVSPTAMIPPPPPVTGRRDAITAGDVLPPPPFNKTLPISKDEKSIGFHRRQESSGSNPGFSVGNYNNNNNNAVGYNLSRIPPWERVERVQYQNWFRPGPHQTGALQTFDATGLTMSNLQSVPILKKTLQHPIDIVVHSIEVEEHLR